MKNQQDPSRVLPQIVAPSRCIKFITVGSKKLRYKDRGGKTLSHGATRVFVEKITSVMVPNVKLIGLCAAAVVVVVVVVVEGLELAFG